MLGGDATRPTCARAQRCLTVVCLTAPSKRNPVRDRRVHARKLGLPVRGRRDSSNCSAPAVVAAADAAGAPSLRTCTTAGPANACYRRTACWMLTATASRSSACRASAINALGPWVIMIAQRHPSLSVVLSSDMHEETHTPVVTADGVLVSAVGQDSTRLGQFDLGIEGGRGRDWESKSIVSPLRSRPLTNRRTSSARRLGCFLLWKASMYCRALACGAFERSGVLRPWSTMALPASTGAWPAALVQA